MRIIIDAMGGDNAPFAPVKGALQAAEEFGCEIVLVGIGEELLRVLQEIGVKSLPDGVEIAHADQVITMEDNPAKAFKEKKASSLTVALNLLRDGGGDAVISAGSTGALLSAATLIVKRVRGIRRAALAPVIPTSSGGAVLIDCGANVECTAEQLLQFGFMGSFYAAHMLSLPEPRVGLLNIGTESGKGTPLRQEAHALLTKAHEAGRLHFVGNIEAKDAILGAVDVIVTDGFTGNVFLKSIEGAGGYFAQALKKIFYRNLKTKLAAAMVKDGIADFKRSMDSREVGGTALLGISKPVIKAHGSSDAYAIRSAVRQAIACSKASLADSIAEHIEEMRITSEGETPEKRVDTGE